MWDLQRFECPEPILIDQTLIAEGQWLNKADMLADLCESAEPLEDIIHGHKEVQLVVQKLELVRAVLTEVLERLWRPMHVLQVHRDAKAFTVCISRWLLVHATNLVEVRDVHAD